MSSLRTVACRTALDAPDLAAYLQEPYAQARSLERGGAYARAMEERRELTPAQLARERQGSPPRLHIVAQSSTFPLLELGDRQFERLAHDLLAAKASAQAGYDRVTLMQQGADRGRDILLYSGGRLTGIVQCKRKVTAIGLPEIKRELLKYCLFAVRDPSIAPHGPGARYALWTASGLNEAAKSFFDDAAIRTATLDDITVEEVERVRKTLKTLAQPDAEQALREATAAIRLAQAFAFSHVGPSDIYPMLRTDHATRRAHFRSPDDTPRQASVEEVTTLLDERRGIDQRRYEAAGAAGAHPYVARAAIDEAFADFMTEESRLFVLVGGSGQGKTSWAAHLVERPPENWSAHIVRGEDIAETDQNLVETLRRDLGARPTGGITTHELTQALWEWVDGGNNILVVDGLDRVRSGAREALPDWLSRTETLMRQYAVRLVVTSRRESWAAISASLAWQAPHLYAPGGAAASVELGALTGDEAHRLYLAYGVSSDQHSGRPLDSPSLIRRFAQLKSGRQEAVVTRYDVLSADFDAMLVELGKSPEVTTIAVTVVMNALGTLLRDHADGWVPITALAATVQGAPAVLEALVKGDRATLRNDAVRLESDDMIELVIGRQLTTEIAAKMLYERRDEPLVVGGIAMMIAATETRSIEAARALLDTLLAVTPTGRSGALDAVARSLLELRAPEAFIEQAAAAVTRWREMNLLLGMSQLGDMIGSVALPAADRLKLMWPLVASEEADDWRSKYWFDPELGGRIVTAFAVAAERAARASGPDVVDFLIERSIEPDEPSRSAARFLLHIAVDAAPDVALAKCWEAPRDTSATVFGLAAQTVPGAALRFLGGDHAAAASSAELVIRLHHLSAKEAMGRVAAPSPDDILFAVDRLMPRAETPQLEALVQIAALRARPDELRRKRLAELWPHVDTDDYWRAISLLTGPDQERLLVELITGADAQHDRAYLLGNLGAHRLDAAIYGTIIAHIDTLYRKEPDLTHQIALAVEGMLYEVMPANDPGRQLFRLALEIAGSENDKARLALLYYAGSAQGDVEDEGDLDRRRTILARLVEAESGANLGLLMWKIAESAHERPDAVDHAMRLIERLGVKPLLKATRAMGELGYMVDLRHRIDAVLAERRQAARGARTGDAAAKRRGADGEAG